jgi:hypothetical protein
MSRNRIQWRRVRAEPRAADRSLERVPRPEANRRNASLRRGPRRRPRAPSPATPRRDQSSARLRLYSRWSDAVKAGAVYEAGATAAGKSSGTCPTDLAENPAREPKGDRLALRPGWIIAPPDGLESVDEGAVRPSLICGTELPLGVGRGGASQAHMRHQLRCGARSLRPGLRSRTALAAAQDRRTQHECDHGLPQTNFVACPGGGTRRSPGGRPGREPSRRGMRHSGSRSRRPCTRHNSLRSCRRTRSRPAERCTCRRSTSSSTSSARWPWCDST